MTRRSGQPLGLDEVRDHGPPRCRGGELVQALACPDQLVQAAPLDEAVDWMQSRKQTWEARVDRLDAHLRRGEPG